MKLFYTIISMIICIIICLIFLIFLRTDCEFLFNIIFRRNTYVANDTIRTHWQQLTKIMYEHTNIIEPGANSIPNKTNDICEYFIEHPNRMKITNIAEIGFNAGHSCVCLLVLFPESKITVFDLCEHTYTEECFNLLNTLFPNRIKLIKGDSTQTVPLFNTNDYDLVHIDGGHFEDVPFKDLNNTYNHLLSDTGYIIYDDTHYKNSILLNMGLSKCHNIFKTFAKELNFKILKNCNGSTISYINKLYII
jgi:hypothetical protein